MLESIVLKRFILESAAPNQKHKEMVQMVNQMEQKINKLQQENKQLKEESNK